ncbi:hypothetical protein APASM_2353 [Actinosynnema pretiosum subsp. pretiosum]|nr:hypothetical protein APASM_2353 [Actinosynnema pretiosum subsp. pretiosum]
MDDEMRTARARFSGRTGLRGRPLGGGGPGQALVGALGGGRADGTPRGLRTGERHGGGGL